MKFLQCDKCKLILPFGDFPHDDETSKHVLEHERCRWLDFESTEEQESAYFDFRKRWVQAQKDRCETQIATALEMLREAQEESRQLERRFPTERHNYW